MVTRWLVGTVCLVAALVAACGDGASDSIGPDGGSVTSDDGLVSLVVPPGALDERTQISVSAVAADDAPAAVREQALGDVVYRLEPEGLVFSEGASVEWDLQGVLGHDSIDAGVPLLLLTTVRSGEEPEALDAQEIRADMSTGQLIGTGQLDHFSWLVIQRSDTPLVGLLEQVEPREWLLGQAFTVASHLRYVGDGRGDLVLEYHGFGAVAPVDESGGFSLQVQGDADEPTPATDALPERSFFCGDVGLGTYTLTIGGVLYDRSGHPLGRPPVRMTMDGVVECVDPNASADDTDDSASVPFTVEVPNPGDQELGDQFEVRVEITPNIGPGGTSDDPRAVTGGRFTVDGSEPAVGPPEVAADPRFQATTLTGTATAMFTCIEVGSASITYTATAHYTPHEGDPAAVREQVQISGTSPSFECLAPTEQEATSIGMTGTGTCQQPGGPLVNETTSPRFSLSHGDALWTAQWDTYDYIEHGSLWSERNDDPDDLYTHFVEFEVGPDGQEAQLGVRYIYSRGSSWAGTRVDIFTMPDRLEQNVTASSVDGGPFQYTIEGADLAAFDGSLLDGGLGMTTRGLILPPDWSVSAIQVAVRIFDESGFNECVGRVVRADAPDPDAFGTLGSHDDVRYELQLSGYF